MAYSIPEFQGPYRFLSNFWPCEIRAWGLVFPSVEHAYVAAKTDDKWHQLQISKLPSAGDAKRYGRKLNLCGNWDLIKQDCMLDFLRQKFQEKGLAKMLLNTGNLDLIEGNRWGDTYWGVCNGVGENHLGRLLMQVRDEIALNADLF